MKYMGSKARLAKNIVPIINSYKSKVRLKYKEPFVGGANIADKVDFMFKSCSDKNPYLIALLDYVSKGGEIPKTITECEYYQVRDNKENYPFWYVGLVGFCASYGGRFFEGYPRGNNSDGTARDYTNESIRNLEQQRKSLRGIVFSCSDFIDLDYTGEKCVIYCDPPYRNSKPYRVDLLGKFDSDLFWNWVNIQSKLNPVLVSEYEAPPQYISLFDACLKSNLKIEGTKESTEYLFVHEKWVSERIEYFGADTLFSMV
jgi:site-specific DNA-adenine methylase